MIGAVAMEKSVSIPSSTPSTVSPRNVAVLSISGGGVLLPEGDSHASGAFLRQLDYARCVKEYHVISNTHSKTRGAIKPLSQGNAHFYPVFSSNRLGFVRQSILLGGEIIEKRGIQCITCADPWFTGLAGMALSRRYKLPLDVSIMSDVIGNPHFLFESPFRNFPGLLLAKWILKSADAIRVSTEAERKKLSAIYGSKVYVSRFYVNPGPYSKKATHERAVKGIREKLLQGQKSFLVLFVGRFARQKRLDVLTRAAFRVLQKHPHVQFVYVGYGPERKNIEKLIQSQGLGEHVTLTGKIAFTEVPAYFQACDLFAITSQHEGTCMVLLEAALSGKPVVATAFAGAQDLLQGFEDEALRTVNDPESVAEGICRQVENPESGRRLGLALRDRALENFDPENICRQRSEKWMELVRKKDLRSHV